MRFSTWNVDASQILSRQELAAVLKDLKRRAARLPNVQMNLAIVRLACCCGLRASEIGGLSLGDVCVGIARPHLLVRAEHAKLNRPRRVPLWWDAGTLADLSAWLDHRYDQGAGRDDPFICSLQTATLGQPLNRHVLRRRFHTACRVLGWDRLRNLTIHHGRHTFISHALAGGRTLAEVKAAAGHASLLTTSVYLHVVVDEARIWGRCLRPMSSSAISALGMRCYDPVRVLVIVREPIANIRSAIARDHWPQELCEAAYVRRTHDLAKNLSDSFAAGIVPEVLTYEGLIEPFLAAWLPRIGLPYVPGEIILPGQIAPPGIDLQNEKWYSR